MVGKLRDMKRRGVSFLTVPEHEKPYCEKEVKNIFIKEVVNYMPAFSDPELVKHILCCWFIGTYRVCRR
jgi:hypothetical protein